MTREILATQFEYLRSGDRYWYENVLSTKEIAQINNATLSEIIQRNTNITDLQENVFYDASMMYHRMPSGGEAQDLYLYRDGNQLIMKDQDGLVIHSASWRKTSGIVMVGAAGQDEPASTFVIDASLDMRLSGGINVIGGDNGQDSLEVWGRDGDAWTGRDHIKVYEDQVRISKSKFGYRDVGELKILGRGGNDNIRVMEAMSSRLYVDGGSGNDGIVGSRGDDWLVGGAGNDRMYARDGSDYVDGGDGNDIIYGQAGHNILIGGDGRDQLFGGGSRDLLIGGLGRDVLLGGWGDDLLIGGVTDLGREQLMEVMAEWTSTRESEVRVENIRGTGSGPEYDDRLNGDSYLLPGVSVGDDEARDVIFGSAGRDWVFFKLGSDLNLGHRRWDTADYL